MKIPTTIGAAAWASLLAHLSLAAVPDCPFPGPAFPKPTKLTSSENFKSVLANLTETFKGATEIPRTTPTARPEVNGDTIYRLGSLTKIFTILTFLIEAGDGYWNTPITKFVPELALLADKYQYDPVMNVDWAGITLGELASHTAGIVRDYALLGELTQENNQTVLESQGFPPAPINETPLCGEWITCNRAQLFKGLGNVPPSFSTAWTVGYSNVGYQILSYALEAITGKKFANMLQSDVIDKLGLEHTYYQKPPDNLGIIVQGQQSGWNYSLGDASPGQLPWGVKRIPLSNGSGGSRITDAYNKAGSINAYSSLIILLPDYDVGITVLLAGGWPGNANWNIADAIGETLVPALEEAARMEAGAMYAGTYSSNSSSDTNSASLNSTIVLSTESGRPGLGIDRWISNGTDMVPVAIRYTLNYNVTGPALRLYPTGLEKRNEDGSRKVAFKAMIQDRGATDHVSDMFSTNCGTWVGQTTAVYASMPLDQFVFHLDADGGVKSIEPLALRAVLEKD
ncbi:beta-lactamase-like 1 [Apiospora arundinis]